METKQLYNFLPKNCLFFYRVNSFTLSNSIGTLTYLFHRTILFAGMQCPKAFQPPFTSFPKSRFMNNTEPNVLAIIIRFDKALQRYAHFIIKDTAIAALLVKDVFELVYDENGFAKPEKELRLNLKNYTLAVCRYWLQVDALQKAQKN